MTTVKKHNAIRDLVVYSLSTAKAFTRHGNAGTFVKDLADFGRWRRYRNSSEGTLYYKVPWLVFRCIDFLEQWLRKDMKVYEYGSGGSTLFFAAHVNKVWSVDHDQEWYKITKQSLADGQIKNVDYKLLEGVPDKDFNKKNPLDPTSNLSARREFRGLSFDAYVNSIDEFDDQYFDLVVVDGRARQSCILHAVPKIKKGGILLLDNADRRYYLDPYPELNDSSKWEQKIFTGHFPFAPASVLNKTIAFTKK